MQLQKVYELVVKLGQQNDPRSAKEIQLALKAEAKTFAKLEKKAKAFFDPDRLTNPYSDTRLLVGSPQTKVQKIAAGIDVNSAEFLLIQELNRKGAKINLAFAHHPEGLALARLDSVLRVQEDLYAELGVPVNVIENLIDREVPRVQQALHPINHQQHLDFARLLKIPFMCCHTPADNLAYQFIKALIAREKPRTLNDVLELLMAEPEYQISAKNGVPPLIFAGQGKSRVGKISVTGFTGGTSGSSKIYESLRHVGVGTEIAMHVKPDSLKEAKKHHINIIIAGHIASDSLGMNLVLDELEKQGLEIVPFGGLIRVSRLKGKNKIKGSRA